jgi:chemotaxis protein methyltransferase CheR
MKKRSKGAAWSGPRGEMTPATYQSIRDIVYQHSGISLGDNKQPLVKARIQKRMRVLGLNTYSEYAEYVKAESSGVELQQLLDAISTNVTSFYRESHHFEFMREVVDEMLQTGSTQLRIWSSACSTGEEPYTIAIELLEAVGRRYMDTKILATDISTKVLRECHLAEYDARKVATVPAQLRNRYFSKSKRPNGDVYTVDEKLRQMVHLRQFNLTNFPYAISGPMDFVFCRNVMIYFDRPTRAEIIKEFSRIVRPGGYLFVGHSESLSGMPGGFVGVRPSIYRRG